MKWIKKWYYLILFVSTGIGYLVCVSGWQVYSQAVAKDGFGMFASGLKDVSGGSGGGKNVPAGNGGNGFWNGPPVSGGDGEGSDGWEPGEGEEGSGWESGSEGSGGWEPGEGEEGSGWESGSEGADGWESGDGEGSDGWESGECEGDGEGADNWEPGDDSWQEEPGETGIFPATVEDDYFADAVFIGDSRTVGLGEYGGLEDIATFYASTGLSVHKMFTAQIVPVAGQKKKITVEEALQGNTFSKIYLMIGINEMGTGTVDTFMEKYAEAVAHLQELQPEAVIYLQGIMKVTTKRSGQGDYITNEGIEERNERISQLADNKKIFYLDVNPVICDESGGMEASYTHDGVHLKGKYIELWKQFLKENAYLRQE